MLSSFLTFCENQILNILYLFPDDGFNNDARATLSDAEDEEGDKDDEKWRIDRLEREKWIQGEISSAFLYKVRSLSCSLQYVGYHSLITS